MPRVLLRYFKYNGSNRKRCAKKIYPQGLLLPDNRGKKAPPNKLIPSEEQFIHDQIQSFPAVESHYCRPDSAVRYLDPSLNITMHREYQSYVLINQSSIF